MAAPLSALDYLRASASTENRLSVSDFTRSNVWKSKLESNVFLEIQDRGDRMADFLEYIDYLEELFEDLSVRKLIESRDTEDTEWLPGKEISDKAIAFLEEHYDEWTEAQGAGL